MLRNLARHQFYDDAFRFLSQHPGADDLSFRYLGLARRIYEHFQSRPVEKAFFMELEAWVEEQLHLAKPDRPDLKLRRFRN